MNRTKNTPAERRAIESKQQPLPTMKNPKVRGRKPEGLRALTPAERQRRRRERLTQEAQEKDWQDWSKATCIKLLESNSVMSHHALIRLIQLCDCADLIQPYFTSETEYQNTFGFVAPKSDSHAKKPKSGIDVLNMAMSDLSDSHKKG